MRNRVTTLLELEATLGRRATSVTPKAASSRATSHALSAGRPRRHARGRIVALAFDLGQPIQIVHDGPRHELNFARSSPSGARSGLAYSVESFESDDTEELDSLQHERADTTDDEANALLAEHTDERDDEEKYEREEEEEEDERAVEASAATAKRPAFASRAFAEQLQAVERDLRELAPQAKTRDPEPAEPGSDGDRQPESPPPPMRSKDRPPGHAVFDAMARGMDFATDFRVGPVTMNKVFADMDRRLDAEQRRQVTRVAAPPYQARASTVLPVAVSDAELARDLAALTPPRDVVDAPPSPLVAGLASPTGHLLHFAPPDLVLTDLEAKRVFQLLWPDVDVAGLGPITDTDRSFAQALLIEAMDASADMGIVEAIFREAMTIPPDAGEMIKNLAKEAIEKGWFTRARGKLKVGDIDKVTIYESVRATLARNWRSEIKIRIATGNYIGY